MSTSDSTSGGDSRAATIAGATVGTILVVAFAVMLFAIYYCCWHHTTKKSKKRDKGTICTVHRC